MTLKITPALACSLALAAGCGGDFSLPSARPLGPLSGSVLSTRNVAVSWARSDPGNASLCLDVCAARACASRRSVRLPAGVTEYVIPSAMLPEGRAAFWRVRDCDARDEAVRAPVWQFFVPRASALASTARASVEAMSTDLDGDALPDLVYQGAWAGPRRRVERRDRVVGWTGSVLSIAPPADARDVALRFGVAGDLDGNGFADMLVLGRAVEVLLGGLSPELDDLVATGVTLARGADVVGGRDLDGDGRGDVVIASPGELRVCHLDGGAALRCDRSAAPGAGATRVFVRTLGDLDGDATPELALAVAGGDDAGAVLTRRSAASQWQRDASGFDGRVFASLGDLDGDGRAELAWTVRAASLSIASWGVGGVRARPLEVPCDAGGAVSNLVSADLDGDGRRDLAAICDAPDGARRLFVFAGATSAAREVTLTAEDLDASGLLAADDDGDGVSDLFVRTATGALGRLSLPRAQAAEPVESRSEPASTRAAAPVRPSRAAVDVIVAEGTTAEGGAWRPLQREDLE